MRSRSSGLKLKPSKCVLFQKCVTYLGHIVSESGITTDPGKIEPVCEWPVPENVTEIKSFLGLASYYGRFVPNFAQAARPSQINRSYCRVCLDTRLPVLVLDIEDLTVFDVPRLYSRVHTRH